MLYALQSEQQKYFKERINLFVAVAPAGKIEHISSPVLKPLINKYAYYVLDFWNKLSFVNWYRLFDLKWQSNAHIIIAVLPTLGMA